MVKEFIVPLEKQISSEQEEKQVVENEPQEIVGQKRRARTGTSSTSASKEQMVAAGGTRRSKRVKVAPTRYVPVVEEESWTTSLNASSGVLIRDTTLAASPLDESGATADGEISNEAADKDSSQRVLAVAAATRANTRRYHVI